MASSREKRFSKGLRQTTLLEHTSPKLSLFHKNQTPDSNYPIPSERRMVTKTPSQACKESKESESESESSGAIRVEPNTPTGEPGQLTSDSSEENPVRRLKRQRAQVLESDSDAAHSVVSRKRLRKVPKTVWSDNDEATRSETGSQTHDSVASSRLSDEDSLDGVEPERM